MRARSLTIILLTATLASTAAACGDSSEPSPTPQPAVPAAVRSDQPALLTSAPEPTTAATDTGESNVPPAPGEASEPDRTDAEAPEPAPAPPSGRIGYRVTGVAADDVLNVRAGPSADNDIVGALPPDATGVVVMSKWGAPWWEVRLNDGTTGFAHSRFLEMDPAWTVSFEDLPCAGNDAPWGEPQRSPQPAEVPDAQFVYGFNHLSSPECDRFVIQLGTLADPAAPEWGYPSIAADRIPAGIVVRSDANRVIVALPDALDVSWSATTADLGDALLVLTYGPAGWPELEAHLLFASEHVAHTRFVADPARIVIDARPAEVRSAIDLAPFVDGAFILTEPALWDGRLAGTRQPLTITGYGTAYESQVWMGLSRTDGGTNEIQALWTGGFDCTNDPFAPTARGDAYCAMTSGDRIWGDFAITVSDLEPGAYRLSIAGECMVEEVGEDVCEQHDLDYEFIVIE